MAMVKPPQFGYGAPLELVDANALSELVRLSSSLEAEQQRRSPVDYTSLPPDDGSQPWLGIMARDPSWDSPDDFQDWVTGLDSLVGWMHCDPDLLDDEPASPVALVPIVPACGLGVVEQAPAPAEEVLSSDNVAFPPLEPAYFIERPIFTLPKPRGQDTPDKAVQGFSPDIIRNGVSWLQPQESTLRPRLLDSWTPFDPSKLSEYTPLPLQELLLVSQNRRREDLLDFLLNLLQKNPSEFYQLLEREVRGGPVTEAVRELHRACLTTSLGLSLPPLQARLLKFLASCLLARVYDRGLLMLVKYGCSGARCLANLPPRKFQEPCYGLRLVPAAQQLAWSSLRQRDTYYHLETDADPYYAQKLLDYYYGDERNPYLGCFTLSNIGTSFHTFHKPRFDNTAAVFRVRMVERNSLLFDRRVENAAGPHKPVPCLSNLYACSGRTVLVEHLEPFPLAVSLPGMAYRFIYLHNITKPDVARRKILTATAANRQISFRLQAPTFTGNLGAVEESQVEENEEVSDDSPESATAQATIHQGFHTSPCIPSVPPDAIYFYDKVPDSHPLTNYIFEDENGNAALAKDEEDRFELVYPFLQGPQGHVRVTGYHMRNRFLLVRSRRANQARGSLEMMQPVQVDSRSVDDLGLSIQLRASEWQLRPLPCCILAGQLHPSTAMTFPKPVSTRSHQEDNQGDQDDNASTTSQGGALATTQTRSTLRNRKSGKAEGRSQNDNAVTVLNFDSIKLYMQSRCVYCFKKLIDASPDHLVSIDSLLRRYEGLTFSANKNAFGREAVKMNFAEQEGGKYYGLREDHKGYESVESNKGNVYSSPLQMLLVENMLASGTWVSDFLDNAHVDSFVWELANVSVGNCKISNAGIGTNLQPGIEASVGRFLADRFKGWINIVCSFLTSERLKYFVTLREKNDFQSFGVVERTSYQSFGGYFLRYGDKIDRFRSLPAHPAEFWDKLGDLDPCLRPSLDEPDMIFQNPLHPITYDLESVSDSAKYAEAMYSLFSDPAYRSSFFYFTDKLFAANFSFLGLFTRKCNKEQLPRERYGRLDGQGARPGEEPAPNVAAGVEHGGSSYGAAPDLVTGVVEPFRANHPELRKIQEVLQAYEAELFNDAELTRELRFDLLKSWQVIISEGLCNCQQSSKESPMQDEEMERDITDFGLNVQEIRRMRDSSTRMREFQTHYRSLSLTPNGARRAQNRPRPTARAQKVSRPRPAPQIVLVSAATSQPSRLAISGLRLGPTEQPKPDPPRTGRGRSSDQQIDPSSLIVPPLPLDVVDKQTGVYAQLNVRLIDLMVKKLNPIDIVEAIANRNVPAGAQGIPPHCLKRTYAQPCSIQPTLTEYMQQFAKRINCRMRVYLTSYQRHLVRKYLEKVSTDKALSKISTYMNVLEGEAAALRLDDRLDIRMPKVYAIDPSTWSSGRWLCEYGRCPLVSEQSKRGHLAHMLPVVRPSTLPPGIRPITYDGFYRSNIIPQPQAWANPRAPKGVKIFLPENFGSHYYPLDRLLAIGIKVIPYLSGEVAASYRTGESGKDTTPMKMYPYHLLHSNPPTLVTRGEGHADAWGPSHLPGKLGPEHKTACSLEPEYRDEVLDALDQAGQKISHIDDKKQKKSYKVIRMSREAVEHCDEFSAEPFVTFKTFSDRWTNWLSSEPYVYDRKLSYTVSVVQKLEQRGVQPGCSQVTVTEKNIGEVLGKSYWFPRRVINAMAEIVYKCHASDVSALIRPLPRDSLRCDDRSDARRQDRRTRYEDQDYGEEAKDEEVCYYYVLPIVPDRTPLNHHMRGNLNIRVGSALKRELFRPDREAQQAMCCQAQRNQWEAESERRKGLGLSKLPMPTIPPPSATDPPGPHYRSRGLYSDYLVYPGIGI